MKLTEKKKQVSRLRVGLSAAACFVLIAAAGTSAVALRVNVDSQAAADKASSNKDIPTSVPANVMAGNMISKVNPKYPPDAKKARIQGTVILDAVVGKTGDVENLKVVSGPNELQQSSLDAVRQWKYKPFLVERESD